ncbi:MAG: class I SAM-dependent methyltransferase [Opitutaceae bacterium]|nr:class I SAM-dependent methyltransferase [Opitutaceae bacterium]
MTRAFLRWFRHVRRLEKRVALLEQENARMEAETREWRRFHPPGHFYSPIPAREEIDDAFRRADPTLAFGGVELDEAAQFALLQTFAGWLPQMPFPEHATPEWRYHLDNPSYAAFDGVMLYSMLRHAQPRRIIEVGSGFSSAAMLDLNEHVFGGRMELTFIDPDMRRLRALLRLGDESRVRMLEQRVQEVPLAEFDRLEAGDVLFIDSSHVAKIGSDVNRLYFDVLPRLKPGVFIHIHDVAANLEYPREWLEEGRAWNESYLLRAFLMYNGAFEVVLFSPWIAALRAAWLHEHMPVCARGGGGQIWLRRKQVAGR